MDTSTRRILWSQALLSVAAASVFAVADGLPEALAAGYGGMTTLAGSWWMARGIWRSGQLGMQDGARALYGGWAQKYLIMIAALAIGLGPLTFAPLPLLAGFAAAHAGFLFVGRRQNGQNVK